jgi:hypothetical protein
MHTLHGGINGMSRGLSPSISTGKCLRCIAVFIYTIALQKIEVLYQVEATSCEDVKALKEVEIERPVDVKVQEEEVPPIQELCTIQEVTNEECKSQEEVEREEAIDWWSQLKEELGGSEEEASRYNCSLIHF